MNILSLLNVFVYFCENFITIPMRKITATVITYNEGENIERCLKSLQGVADEIIVVDSFSTDNTLEICSRYDCFVTQRRFNGYGAQKQYAVSLSTNSYILSIDADEYLDDDLRRSIIKLKNDGFAHRIYSLDRLNYYCNVPVKHSGWSPDCPIRLFDKRYASWNLRDVHEAVIFPGTLRPQLIFGLLIHHKCNSAEEHRRKEDRFASINAKILINEGRKSNIITPYFKAAAAFLYTYFRRLGCLDGSVGIEISRTAAHSAFATYQIMRRNLKNMSEPQ